MIVKYIKIFDSLKGTAAEKEGGCASLACVCCSFTAKRENFDSAREQRRTRGRVAQLRGKERAPEASFFFFFQSRAQPLQPIITTIIVNTLDHQQEHLRSETFVAASKQTLSSNVKHQESTSTSHRLELSSATQPLELTRDLRPAASRPTCKQAFIQPCPRKRGPRSLRTTTMSNGEFGSTFKRFGAELKRRLCETSEPGILTRPPLLVSTPLLRTSASTTATSTTTTSGSTGTSPITPLELFAASRAH